jgi:L-aspartate oxidase
MQTDVLIIGCGIAGATAALELSRDGQRRVTLITRAERPEESASSLAQGGIVGQGEDDSPDSLAEDVLRAGAGLSFPPAVRALAEEGPRLVEELLVERSGVRFDREDSGRAALGLEGAHSRRRILHVGDATGKAIMKALMRELEERPNVTRLDRCTAVDLLTFPHHSRDPLAVYTPVSCHGAYAFDQERRTVSSILARWTIIATGGLGQIFLNTTNPPGARGDGLAMAYRAGARVVNAEYMQFHPTALHMAGTTKQLISEAVRGEGGVLLTPEGERFMERYAPDRLELATRDVVARASYREMLTHGYPYLLLDIASRRPADFIRQRFPQIHSDCLEHRIDITRQPIPVVPAAHYFCGGVLVDLWGRTTVPGLYALGEVACTGVHGANRLASTSLLEGLVWGARAGRHIRREPPSTPAVSDDDVPAWDESGLSHDADPALIHGDMQAIRNLMWHYVGLLRHEHRLGRALRELRRLWLNIEDFYRQARLSDDLIGLRNAILNAVIVARAARQNPVSRGCHYREDALPSSGGAPPDGANDAHQ